MLMCTKAQLLLISFFPCPSARPREDSEMTGPKVFYR